MPSADVAYVLFGHSSRLISNSLARCYRVVLMTDHVVILTVLPVRRYPQLISGVKGNMAIGPKS